MHVLVMDDGIPQEEHLLKVGQRDLGNGVLRPSTAPLLLRQLSHVPSKPVPQ